MRRLGMEDEFKPAEQLLEEFERRAQDEGEDAELVSCAVSLPHSLSLT